jgi:hypothetical protein
MEISILLLVCFVMELVRRIIIFYCMKEETHSIKRSPLFIVMVVGNLGFEELSAWATLYIMEINILLLV